MCEKSVDKTESSSNFWRISPLNDEYESTESSSLASSATKIEIKHLGVEKVDPNFYSKQYGTSLKPITLLPEAIVQKVKQVDRITLAAEQDAKYFMGLEGDIHALCMIDLEKEGLSDYKKYLRENLTCQKDKTEKSKPKTEILNQQLAGQELISLDLYKERLNEYKKLLKPTQCDEIEKKEDKTIVAPTITTPLTMPALAVTTPIDSRQKATPNMQNPTQPLLTHPTNYAYNPVQNLYYLLQFNLLKSSLLQHYLQNVTLTNYLGANRGIATNNFLMNRNFF